MNNKKTRQTSLRRWTQAAKDCLEIGCVCENCTLYKKFFKYSHRQCQMKRVVLDLVTKFGHPKDVKAKTILNEDTKNV